MENILNQMVRQQFINQVNPNDMPYKFDDSNQSEPIGICYVPMQKWEKIYDEDTAYSVGTLFPSLNLPFLGGGK